MQDQVFWRKLEQAFSILSDCGERADAAAASAAQGNSKEFRLEMKGVVPPWTLGRICRVLNATQQGNYQVLISLMQWPHRQSI